MQCIVCQVVIGHKTRGTPAVGLVGLHNVVEVAQSKNICHYFSKDRVRVGTER